MQVTASVAEGDPTVNGEEVVAPTAPGDVKVVYIPVEELNAFEGNPRQRTEKVLEHLKKSILEFGFVDPVIVWANAGEFGYPPNTILGGHRRLDAYRSLIENRILEATPVPCVPVTLDAVEKAKALNVALNKIGEEFNFRLLAEWLGEIKLADFDVEAIGFDDHELEGLLNYRPDSNYAERTEAEIDKKLAGEEIVCPKCGYVW